MNIKNQPKSPHSSHLKMMAICCGIPIVGFLIIAGAGINAPSLETLLLLACPVGMGVMMYMMHQKSNTKGASCCNSEEVDHSTTSGKITIVDIAESGNVSEVKSPEITFENKRGHGTESS